MSLGVLPGCGCSKRSGGAAQRWRQHACVLKCKGPAHGLRRYGVSKLAEISYTKLLAKQLAPRRIAVTAVCPGAEQRWQRTAACCVPYPPSVQ